MNIRKGSQRGKENNVKEFNKNTRGALKVQEKLGLIINTEIKDISVPLTLNKSSRNSTTVKMFSASYTAKKKKKKKKKERKKEKRLRHCAKKGGKFKVQQKIFYIDCYRMFQGVQKAKPRGNVGKSRFTSRTITGTQVPYKMPCARHTS